MAATASHNPKIGWIGLGKMGFPICKRLAAQFDVMALTRNSEATNRAAQANLQGRSSIREVVDGAEIVASAVSDDAALLDIVFRDDGLKDSLKASQVFVEISTVSPNASARVAAAMSAIAVDYLRSPVSGSTATASQGALTAILSGPPQRDRPLARLLYLLHAQDFRRRERGGSALSEARAQRCRRRDVSPFSRGCRFWTQRRPRRNRDDGRYMSERHSVTAYTVQARDGRKRLL